MNRRAENFRTLTASHVDNLQSGRQVFFRLMPIVVVLWGFFFVRVHAIDTLPYFVDELRHVGRSQVVWSFSDIEVSTTPHKFLLYYWLGLFDLPLHLPGWLARTAVSVFSLLGAAGTYALGRRLFSPIVGLLSLGFLSLFPFMFFYDRLALADPLTSSLIVLIAWWSLIVARHPTRRYGAVLGILICLMLAAKVLGGPLLLLPVTSILLVGLKPFNLRRNYFQQAKCILRQYRQPALTAILIVGIVWGIILTFYAMRTDFGQKEDTSPIVNNYLYQPAGYENNLERVEEAVNYLWGSVLTVLAVIAFVGLLLRNRSSLLYLLSGILPLWWTLLAIAGQLSTRYLTLVGHLWVVLIMGGLVSIESLLKAWTPFKSAKWRSSFVTTAILMVWGIGFGGRFWQTLIDEPTQLELPARDQHEYFRNQTGYALQNAVKDVSELPTISSNSDYPVLVGLVRNCSFLPHYIPDSTHINIKCSVYSYFHRDEWPPIDKRMKHLNKMLETYGSVYMIIEVFDAEKDNPLIDLDMVNGELDYQRTYERPFDGIPVELYIVHPIIDGDNVSMAK